MSKANSLNFSGGPGALPETVLRQSQQAIIALPETGISVLGMSHRSYWFKALVQEAEDNIRALLNVGREYRIAFMQGGSSLQFAMIPMSFASGGGTAPAYVTSGYWSTKATTEAARVRPVNEIWNGRDSKFSILPDLNRFRLPADTPYLHYVSNETVEGLQYSGPLPKEGIPLITDMSSDFLSRRINVTDHAMIYAHAQKNLGPAGVTVVLIHESMLEKIPKGFPSILDYRTHIEHASNYNTPPVFAIYVLTLVSRWLRYDIGGLEAMEGINQQKSDMLYKTLDEVSDVIALHAEKEFRSHMNVAFKFKDSRLTEQFLKLAREREMVGLEGHRSLGGMRASLYNAVTVEAVEELSKLLFEFCHVHT